MNGIIAGNIASFVEQLNSVLETQIKAGQLITVKDNTDEKQLTISISTAIANSIDIYNVVRGSVLYVYIFHIVKKGKKQSLDSKDKTPISNSTLPAPAPSEKEIVINYKDAVAYNITLAAKGIASIGKNVKKQKLDLIARLDDSRTLYKFMNKYLFMIDANGFLYYYPDCIDITSLKSWTELSSRKNNLATIIDSRIPLSLDQYLVLNNYVFLECHLDSTAYGLCDVLGCNTESSNVFIPIADNMQQEDQNKSHDKLDKLDKQSNGEEELKKAPQEKCNLTQSECAEASYSTLGYILSWLNPLAYYSRSDNNTITQESSNTNTSSNQSIINQTSNANTTSLPENNSISITIPNSSSSNKLNASYYRYNIIF